MGAKWNYTLLALLAFVFTKAQVNLVPNPGFEDYYEGSNLDYIAGRSVNGTLYNISYFWFRAKSSPDLFTYNNSLNISPYGCIGGGGIKIPETILGFQYARTDSNYIGLGTFYNYLENPTQGHNYYAREWAGVRLADTLKPGKCYEFTMYVSRAEKNGFNVSCLGAYFTKDSLYTELLSEPPWYISPFPLEKDSIQVLQDPTEPIWDTVNWVPITGTFKAKGGEAFLYIGNLLKDEYYTPLPIQPYSNPDSTYCQFSYFFIDDVTLYEIDEPCGVGINENKAGEIKIYPNPAQDFVSIELPKNINQTQLSIYNLTGQLISQKQITQPSKQIPIAELSNGTYIFVIQNGDKVIGRQRVVVAR